MSSIPTTHTDVVQCRLAPDVRQRLLNYHGRLLNSTSKNYRKPVLQRYVVRILLMYVHHTLQYSLAHIYRVPIYSGASWASLVSITAASYVDPLRDVYEVPPSALYTQGHAKHCRLSPSIPSCNY
jgi:hypothetical protein